MYLELHYISEEPARATGVEQFVIFLVQMKSSCAICHMHCVRSDSGKTHLGIGEHLVEEFTLKIIITKIPTLTLEQHLCQVQHAATLGK